MTISNLDIGNQWYCHTSSKVHIWLQSSTNGHHKSQLNFHSKIPQGFWDFYLISFSNSTVLDWALNLFPNEEIIKFFIKRPWLGLTSLLYSKRQFLQLHFDFMLSGIFASISPLLHFRHFHELPWVDSSSESWHRSQSHSKNFVCSKCLLRSSVTFSVSMYVVVSSSPFWTGTKVTN